MLIWSCINLSCTTSPRDADGKEKTCAMQPKCRHKSTRMKKKKWNGKNMWIEWKLSDEQYMWKNGLLEVILMKNIHSDKWRQLDLMKMISWPVHTAVWHSQKWYYNSWNENKWLWIWNRWDDAIKHSNTMLDVQKEW